MNRTLIYAKTKRIGDEIVIALPPKELEKLEIGENDEVVVEIRKYLTHISPR